MNKQVMVAIMISVLGLGAGGTNCGSEEGLTFLLGTGLMNPGGEGVVELVYQEQPQFEYLQEVCGFEVHWSYDETNLGFPDCDTPTGTHSCGTPPLPGHPGLLCLCNASSPGYIEVVAIVSDGYTPLPAGPVVVGEFTVTAPEDGQPDIYPVDFALDSPEVAYVLCEGAQLETEQMGFVDGMGIVLEPRIED